MRNAAADTILRCAVAGPRYIVGFRAARTIPAAMQGVGSGNSLLVRSRLGTALAGGVSGLMMAAGQPACGARVATQARFGPALAQVRVHPDQRASYMTARRYADGSVNPADE